MDTTLQTPFNPAQVEILKLFHQGLTDEQLEELRRTLIAFRFKLLDENVKKVAAQKGISPKQINEATQEHRRTPYRSKRKAALKKGGMA